MAPPAGGSRSSPQPSIAGPIRRLTGRPGSVAALEGELDAGLLGAGEPDARGVLGSRQPDEPDAARLAALHEGDRNLDL